MGVLSEIGIVSWAILFIPSRFTINGVVYIGANDGMLHAFDADNGDELFAYVPNLVFGHLFELTRCI
jgi:type IV pilus assembly protein PilY1